MLLDKELLFRRTTGKLEGETEDEPLFLYEKYDFSIKRTGVIFNVF